MITRSFDADVLKKAFDLRPEMNQGFDCRSWVENTNNVMLCEGGSVGLASYEYPGVYTVHWFFTVHGRDALDLARKMLHEAFETYGAKIVRGLTRTDLRMALIFARKLGFKSWGTLKYPDGEECELFCLTKEEFNEKEKMNGRY